MNVQQHTLDTPYMVGSVHFYSTEINGELVLFDTGPPLDNGKKYLLENVDLSRLKYVLITHCHIDHYGLAYWLEREAGAEIYIPYRDHLKIIHHQYRIEKIIEFLGGMGFSKEFIEVSRNLIPEKFLFPPYPQGYSVVEESLPVHLGIEYLNCPGHSQSDLIFYKDDWAIAGDVLLRGIFQSPLLDVDLETGERFSNYEAYCTTIGKLASLRGKEVFPGHRNRITGVDDTILFYVSKMLDRIEYLQPWEPGENIADIIDRAFGKLLASPFHVYLKASELVFMQDFLKQPLRLKDALLEVGLFSKVEDKFQKIIAA